MIDNAVLAELMHDIRRVTDADKINRLWLKGYITMAEAKKMILDAYHDSKHHFMVMYKENKPGKRYKALSDTVYMTRAEALDAMPSDPRYIFKIKEIPAGNTVVLSARNH